MNKYLYFWEPTIGLNRSLYFDDYDNLIDLLIDNHDHIKEALDDFKNNNDDFEPIDNYINTLKQTAANNNMTIKEYLEENDEEDILPCIIWYNNSLKKEFSLFDFEDLLSNNISKLLQKKIDIDLMQMLYDMEEKILI